MKLKLHELDYNSFKLYRDNHNRYWRRAKHCGNDMFEVRCGSTEASRISMRLRYDQKELSELEFEEVEGC